MAVSSSKMERKQEQVIAALLSCRTIAEAADQAGVGERSIYRYLNEPGFQEAFRAARRRVLSRTTARLQQAAEDAVATLTAMLHEGPAYSRVSAARSILEWSFRAMEIEDVVARLEALEEETGGGRR